MPLISRTIQIELDSRRQVCQYAYLNLYVVSLYYLWQARHLYVFKTVICGVYYSIFILFFPSTPPLSEVTLIFHSSAHLSPTSSQKLSKWLSGSSFTCLELSLTNRHARRKNKKCRCICQFFNTWHQPLRIRCSNWKKKKSLCLLFPPLLWQ